MIVAAVMIMIDGKTFSGPGASLTDSALPALRREYRRIVVVGNAENLFDTLAVNYF